MSRRYWLLVAALGGCLALGAWGLPSFALPNAGKGEQSAPQDVKPQGEPQAQPTSTPPESQPGGESQQAKSEREEDRPERGFWGWLETFIEPANLTNLLIMVFTGLLLWVAWLQNKLEHKLADEGGEALKLTRQSADAATKSADATTAAVEQARLRTKHEVRPYLAVTKCYRVRLAPGAPPKYEVVLENVSSIPAHRATVSYKFGVFDPPNRDFTNEVEPRPRDDMTIQPKAVKTVHCSTEESLSVDELVAIRKGEKAAVIFGFVVYDNVDGSPLMTRFCFVDRAKVTDGETITMHSYGNSAD